MDNKQFDAFVVADLCVDLLFTGTVRPKYGQAEQLIDDYTIDLGGSAAIFAAQFAKLGGKIGLLAKVAEDLFGNMLKDKLKSLGISTAYISTDPSRKTSVGIGLFDGKDRAMLTYTGTMLATQPEDIHKNYLNLTSHWHIASYYLLTQLRSFWSEFIPQLKKQGISLSLDTNWDPEEDWQQVQEILPFVDVFLPNEAEAKHISGKNDLLESGKYLAQYCGLVVVKCGADGAIVFRNDEIQSFAIPAELTENLQIADTTGAGDNFDAGFLRNWLLGKSLEECIHLGIRCGTASLKAIGGIEGQLNLEHE